MMTVREYAEDVNKKIEEIFKKCKELNIEVSNEEDILDEDMITDLDNAFLNDDTENLEEIVEEILEKKEITIDDTVKKQKLKKKNDYVNRNSKKELANKRKEMYKNKEKLKTNVPVNNSSVVLYKENMTIAELATALGVTGAELIKKLFSLGILATLNNSISFENAEILVLDYNKELKKESTADVTNFEEF